MFERLVYNLLDLRHPYREPLLRQQARALVVINAVIIIAMLGWYALVGVPRLVETGRIGTPNEVFLVIVLPLASLASYWFVRRGRVETASALFILATMVFFAAGLPVWERLSHPNILFIVLPAVSAATILNRNGAILSAILLGLLVIVAALAEINTATAIPPSTTFVNVVEIILLTGVAMGLSGVFVRSTAHAARTAMADSQRLRWIIETTLVDNPTNVDEIISGSVNILLGQFNYDYVQVYLANDTEELERKARTGIGTSPNDPFNRVSMGDANVIAEVARLQKTIRVIPNDAESRKHHFQQSIRRSVTIPMVYQNKLYGVLDVQSTKDTPIAEDELELLDVLARQLGANLAQAQAQRELQRNLEEQLAETNRLQNQLSQAQAQRQQLVTRVWSDYLQDQGRADIGFDLSGPNIRPASSMPPTMKRALESGDVYTTIEDGEKLINVPIILRGQAIGAMTFATSPDKVINERQIEMAKTVAGRLGIALENNRLLEQTQAQALRERKANEVANQLISATDLETLLGLAAESFNDTLGAINTHIYIEPGSVENTIDPSVGSPPGANGHEPPPNNGHENGSQT